MPASPPPIQKVVAYITWDGELLVFRHSDHPEAGLQVPAGTLETGETPEQAVLREAQEETGLAGLEIRACLGLQEFEFSSAGRTEIHWRHYFHLVVPGQAPNTWRHFERSPSDGSPGPIAFDFFWLKLSTGMPELSGDLGFYLKNLMILLQRSTGFQLSKIINGDAHDPNGFSGLLP